ncbi:MAG TPA: hypothetical protein DCX32_02025 [Candidatus Moranbacteria bacterium]|nr:MAG: hypothetical protein UW87_C0004G0018 [Candidatus Moranbacteria bacterium GW2011_GWC2_45_10]KKT95476.1 MAG: hypothetical protein UW95_C0001G0040 [Parcubacteria group bacterium GW2011_GWC1_45_14]HAV11300.1 hypothetical protein [Candidatus Moranbacteria bacterium]
MFKLDENFQTKKDPSVGSNKLERGFAEKTLEKDVLGMEDKALELKKRGDARLEEALELCGLETEQIARIKKELKIDEKMRDINIRANNSLARAFHFVKKTITVGLAFLAFSGDAMTGQAQTDGYEKILEEVTMRMKEIASDSAKEIRRTLQEHIASKEYLDKLALEFDGDLGMAEDAQKRRLEYLTSTSSEFMSYDDIQIEMTRREGSFEIPRWLAELSFIKKDFKTVAFYSTSEHSAFLPLGENREAVEHELLHASTKGRKDISGTAKKMLRDSYDPLHDEESDRYHINPTERLVRKQMLDLEMEELGIKGYGEKFTHDHYETLIDLYNKGELSQGAREFIETTKAEYFEEIFNGIAGFSFDSPEVENIS